MISVPYKIINSGSDGNCTIINQTIAIDLGVSYTKLGKYVKTIKVVFLTHEHGDHFNEITIRKLNFLRPGVKFVCLEYLVPKLTKIVPKASIFVLEPNKSYDLGICKASAFPLHHDVENCGWRIRIGNWKMIYVTDTSDLDGIKAKNYNLYLIEANYDVVEIMDRIKQKRLNGEYIYEIRAMNNHLSKQQCDDFLYQNMGENSKFEYMHRHKEKTNDKEIQIDHQQCP